MQLGADELARPTSCAPTWAGRSALDRKARLMSDAAALVPSEGTDYAAALARPPLTNLRRIGGEMFAWTDRDPRRGPALPRGAVLRHLLAQFAGAGPHACWSPARTPTTWWPRWSTAAPR